MMSEKEPNLIRVTATWFCRLHGTQRAADQCLSCKQRYGGHSMRFEALFRTEPTREEIVAAQISKGYHPGGYSGPWRLTTTQTEEGVSAVWYCSDNCD